MIGARASTLLRHFGAPSRLFLFLAVGVWLTWLSWLRPFTLPDEGRYAGVAWEMLRAGSHGVPLLDGMPFFHKPPLYYWLAETSFSLFGVHPWAARVPSWLAAWAVAMALYAFLRHFRSPAAGLVALLALVTQPYFYGGAQFANLDMLVAALIGLTILAGAGVVLRADSGKPYRALSIAAAVLAALAVLAKGLIGVVLPGAVLLLWIALRGRWRGLAALLWPPAIVAFLAVGVPWFWWMQRQYPDFLHYFFIYQQFERFAESTFNNKQPIWFYLPVIAGLALPWTFWLGGVGRKAFWSDAPGADVRVLMAAWISVVLVFFSIPASKLIGYMLPVLPPVAALVAEIVVAALAREGKAGSGVSKAFALCLSSATVLCVVATLIATVYARPNAGGLGARARAEFKPDDTLVMLHAYAYDLSMALRSRQPAWVVDNWSNPEIPLRDNWRKELYDAGQFNQPVMRQTLISGAELQRRLCGAPADHAFWIWGEPVNDVTGYPVLQGIPPYTADSRRALWRIYSDTAFRSRNCVGMPTGG